MSTHKLSRRGFNSIVQVGPTRSGTTLIYNIFRTIFKGPRIEKTHLPFYENYSYKQRDYEQPILYPISIRHPYNSILSLKDFRDLTLQDATRKYMRYGGETILSFVRDYLHDDETKEEHEGLIIFYYEDFFNNIEGIFDIIENKLDMKIDSDIKSNILEEWGIESVIERVNNLGEKDIHHNKNQIKIKWDPETHLNDNHISDRKGDTRFTKLLNESEIEMLKKEHKLNEIINYFYPSPSPEHPYGWNGDERNKKRSF
tara:strand:- start:264 stop:1034 length:771 start_codon:yes stop_codon:yes gene_type:complete